MYRKIIGIWEGLETMFRDWGRNNFKSENIGDLKRESTLSEAMCETLTYLERFKSEIQKVMDDVPLFIESMENVYEKPEELRHGKDRKNLVLSLIRYSRIDEDRYLSENPFKYFAKELKGYIDEIPDEPMSTWF